MSEKERKSAAIEEEAPGHAQNAGAPVWAPGFEDSRDFRRIDILADVVSEQAESLVLHVRKLASGQGRVVTGRHVWRLHDGKAYGEKPESENKRVERAQERASSKQKASALVNVPFHEPTLVGLEEGDNLSMIRHSSATIAERIASALPDMQPEKLLRAMKYAKDSAWREMDFYNISNAGDLCIMPGTDIVMDNADYGNAIWGAAMYCLTVPKILAKLGATTMHSYIIASLTPSRISALSARASVGPRRIGLIRWSTPRWRTVDVAGEPERNVALLEKLARGESPPGNGRRSHRLA